MAQPGRHRSTGIEYHRPSRITMPRRERNDALNWLGITDKHGVRTRTDYRRSARATVGVQSAGGGRGYGFFWSPGGPGRMPSAGTFSIGGLGRGGGLTGSAAVQNFIDEHGARTQSRVDLGQWFPQGGPSHGPGVWLGRIEGTTDRQRDGTLRLTKDYIIYGRDKYGAWSFLAEKLFYC